jgi:hypothetical protein
MITQKLYCPVSITKGNEKWSKKDKKKGIVLLHIIILPLSILCGFRSTI